MGMRALVWDDTIREKIKKQAAWANALRNWYYPERDPESPGDNPAFVLGLDVGFRCVYTHTVMGGKHYRHLSVSVDGAKYPNEIAAWSIATAFGFTGGQEEYGATVAPGADWQMTVNKREHCVVLAQEVPT